MTADSNLNLQNTKPALKVERNWEYFPRHSSEETALFKYEIKPSAKEHRKIFFEVVGLNGYQGRETEMEIFYKVSSPGNQDKALNLDGDIRFTIGNPEKNKKQLLIKVKKCSSYKLEFEIKPTKESRVPIKQNETHLKSNQVLDFSFQKGKGGNPKGVIC